jgi:MFS family permease
VNRRNLSVLTIGYALAAAGGSLVVFVGGIVGGAIAPGPALATLPVALLVVGQALTSPVAALSMERWGRPAGFMTGALVGAAACCVAAVAVSAASFTLFCAGTFFVGASLAFALQYRFAAAETASPERAGRAVSIVMLGGVAAGILGPEIARRMRTVMSAEYAAAFLAAAGLYVLVAAVLRLLRLPARATVSTGAAAAAAPLGSIITRRAFVLAAAAGMVAFGSMSLLMTATPISMHVLDGHPLDAAAFVIQTHVVAMYLPSLFTGALMDRIGTRPGMLIGLAALGGCVAVGASSQSVAAYWTSLALLGLGWNFLFVGGTVVLARAFDAGLRFRAQAANDFIVLGTQSIASLASGAALYAFGWRLLMLLIVPGLVVVTLLVVAPQRPRKARQT